MHELSLVQNLFTQLDGLLRENGAGKICTVRVEIGAFAGVVIDSFEFAFGVLRDTEPWATGARLELSTPLPQYQCECGHIQQRQKLEPGSCDKCGATALTPFGGSDIMLLQVEME
ncbi:MAG: hydrogenase accessory protein HypA [Desulfobacterales bacterium]|nr:MAG: hydrogenase accessory protein HypA [Desulfobacterales bacterium]